MNVSFLFSRGKKSVASILLVALCVPRLFAAYEPNWESLDKRPIPAWFSDAKFGIFIHWGPYSVPAWTPSGTYSEWYQYWMQSKSLSGNGNFKGTEVHDYHVKNFGPHFSYYEFANQFKAELFDPKEWAGLFKKSGARYVVLTSKHHDGFALWPSKEANDRGFAWNSMDTGARRDLLGDLGTAVKEAGIKMGYYYSLFEWYHPVWQADKEKFAREHFRPQFKDLVQRYKPDILWGDGDWDLESEKWGTTELMAWLYNESEVKDTVVINDRWGKGCRFHHGGYYTTEYESGLTNAHPWEECRGMGFSFGYNRDENIETYNSPQVLLLLLSDIVSHGGNLLLDIGPDGHGKIPVIMQERLLQMGEWLNVNGEAIYETRPWKTAVQWSEGKRDYKPAKQTYLGGDFILKLTVNPEPGYAVKEAFFTSKGDTLYAILPKWPEGSFRLKDVAADKDTQITLLGVKQNLKWKADGKDIVVEIPKLSVNEMPCQHAYVLRATKVR